MAELTPQERLQPSLLDRLTDDEPEQRQEARDKRILGLRQLRESVRRDLAWLFNTVHLATVQALDNYPEVERSVLNYGVPELSGLTVSNIPKIDLERQIRQAIILFEPRILTDTLEVHLFVDEEEMSHQALAFEISGDLWARPLPEQLYLKTEIDLELGDVKVVDAVGPR